MWYTTASMKQIRAFFLRWWPLLVFAAVWLALRVLWITCDTGIPSIWEFGFHTTDEGYYLCGGKERLLWGSFVDLDRQEALNYCYSYGTHWLSYLAHLCFGLSTWTWRIPFVILYFCGWLMMFRAVAVRSDNRFAFVTCLAASVVPLVVVYERGASNDATIAALVAIAFSLASGSGRWRLAAAAVATSLIGTVKPSVWVMMPIVLSAVLQDRKTRSRILDAVVYVGLTIAFSYLWKVVSALTVLDVAQSHGMSPWAVLAQVNATYGIPSIMDIAQDFRALASFPRDPSIRAMGALSIFVFVVPTAMALESILRRRWSPRILFYLTMAAYAFALNVINSMYTHYFLPLIILLPALCAAIREDLSERISESVSWKPLLSVSLLLVVVLSVGVLFVSTVQVDIQTAARFYSRIHNLPQENPWRLSWPFLILGTLLGVLFVACQRGLRAVKCEGWAWAGAFFLVASVAFAAYPGAILAPRLKVDPLVFYLPLLLNLLVGTLFVFVLFAKPAALARPMSAAFVLLAAVLLSYLVLPTWRQSSVELVSRRAHYDAYLAQELKQLLPQDAIVLGERTDQALFSLPIRSVTTFLTASNPIPYVEKFLRKDPQAKLFALIDSQCNYNLQHFMKHRDKYRLELVKTFKMPSFSDGRLSDVHLCRVRPLAPLK